MTQAQQIQPVVLRKDLARSIRRGHPWIYRDALVSGDDIEDGAVVEVRTRDGRPIARGFWDTRSPIAIRVLESGGPGHRFADADSLVGKRLRTALQRRLLRLDIERTNAFRWVHGEADLLPGLHVDCYADVLVVRFDGQGARRFYAPLEDRLRQAAGEQFAFRSLLDRTSGRASASSDEVEVSENGIRFLVSPAVGQKGGLFLDQRENRQRVAERARGKSVLNLFGYTGGFAVHAAIAGAMSTMTVDQAKPAIDAARRNFERNDVPLDQTGFQAEDVFDFLPRSITLGEHWDIVVSDPPSFAAKKEVKPAALKAYRRLHQMAATVTKPGGLLCASSCSTQVSEDEFLATIEAGVRQAGRHWQLEATHGAAFDHPVLAAFPEGEYLKFAMGRVHP